MKALSIRQPWVWAIMHAGKRIENRTWWTPYRGKIAIHAARGCTPAEYEGFFFWWRDRFPGRRPLQTIPMPPLPGNLPRGGIVATARIVDCVSESDDPWFFGPYGFVLDDVRPVEFVPYKGALGLFDVPDDVISVARSPGVTGAG